MLNVCPARQPKDNAGPYPLPTPHPAALRLFLIENKSCQFAPQYSRHTERTSHSDLWYMYISDPWYFIFPADFFFLFFPNCKLLPRPFVEYPVFFGILFVAKRCCAFVVALCEVKVGFFLLFFYDSRHIKKARSATATTNIRQKLDSDQVLFFCAYPFLQ